MFLSEFKNSGKVLMYVLAICSISYVFHGIFQKIGLISMKSPFGISGFYYNPAPYAGLLISCSGFIYYCFVMNKGQHKEKIEYLLYGLATLSFVAIIFTKSRAAIVAYIVGFTFFMLFQKFGFKKSSYKINIKWLSLISAICIISLIGVLYFANPSSANGRLLIWKISLLEMFPAKPILGHGIDAFQNFYGNYQASYFQQNPSNIHEMFSVGNSIFSYNEFIKILIEQGVVGLLLFLIVLFFTFYYSLKQLRKNTEKNDKQILLVTITNLLMCIIFCFFSYPFNDIGFLIIFYVTIAIISSEIAPFKKIKINKWHKVPFYLLFSFFLANFILKRYNTYKAFSEWKMMSYTHIGYENLGELQKELGITGKYYIDYADYLYENNFKNEAILVLEQGRKHTSNPTLYLKLGRYYDEFANDLIKAEECYMHVCYMLPYKFYPKYRIFKMYERNNNFDKACSVAIEIVKKPIKVSSERLTEMIIESREFITNKKCIN